MMDLRCVGVREEGLTTRDEGSLACASSSISFPIAAFLTVPSSVVTVFLKSSFLRESQYVRRRVVHSYAGVRQSMHAPVAVRGKGKGH